jgi:hypothetical protein
MRVSVLLFLMPSIAIATGGTTAPTPTPTQAQGQAQVQGQHQGQGQEQTANSASSAVSTASAQGGAGGNSQASSAGQTVITERSAPALGQGSFAIQGCGVAGNAGHSGTGGASFLGFGFTPAQCYDFQLAQAYAALGAYASACDVLNRSAAGKRAQKRGVSLPTCSAPPVAEHPITAQPPSPVVVNVEPALPAPACTKAVRQCGRKPQ